MSTGRSTNRTIVIVVGALVVLCLVMACLVGVAYWQKDQVLGLLGLAQQTQAAKMMPADTPIYMSLSLNLQNQAGYQNLQKLYLDNPDVKKALDDAKANAAKESDLDYDKDILPWLGTEAGVAVFNIPETGSSENPDVLIAVATRDVKASDAALEKLRAKQAETSGKPFEQGTHEGVTYWFQKSDSGSDMYISTFNGFVVLATSEETLFGAIDRVKKGGESLATSQAYQATLAELPKNGAFFTFVDWTALADIVMKNNQAAQLTPEQLAQLKAFQTVGLAFTLQPDGVQVDSAVRFDPKQLPAAMQASLNRPGSPNSVLTKIPNSALGFYSGSDLRAIWQQLREGLAANPDFEQQLADMEQQTGINLDQDVFGWMTGEFAVAVTKVASPDPSTPPLGGYALIGGDDAKTVEDKTANLLEAYSKSQGGMPLPFQKQTIAGHEMNIIPDPSTDKMLAGYGFWDSYLVVGYQEDALAAGFDAASDPVTNNAHFKAVSSRLPAKNYGYFYIDIDAARTLVEGTPSLGLDSSSYAQEVKPFIEPLRAFGSASDAGSGQNGVIKGTMFLLIAEK
jgi:hypothetical protein